MSADSQAAFYGEWQRPHEARIHSSLFDTVSRPLSRRSNGNNSSEHQGHAFADTKVPWDHYGKKYRLYFRREDFERGRLFEALLRQVREQIPNFQGVIAYNGFGGQQVVLYNDSQLRQAMREQGGQLQLYSTVAPGKGFISAADIKGQRSQSVPPQRARYSPEQRPPSSLDSNYQYRPQGSPATGYGAYPPPSPPAQRAPAQTPLPHPPPPPHSPGMLSYAHSQYGPQPAQNLLLAHYLTGGNYPFTKFSWVGPNKYHNFGPYPYRHFYNRGGWGPSW